MIRTIRVMGSWYHLELMSKVSFMFSVHFHSLVWTTKWRGPFYHMNDVNVYMDVQDTSPWTVPATGSSLEPYIYL